MVISELSGEVVDVGFDNFKGLFFFCFTNGEAFRGGWLFDGDFCFPYNRNCPKNLDLLGMINKKIKITVELLDEKNKNI